MLSAFLASLFLLCAAAKNCFSDYPVLSGCTGCIADPDCQWCSNTKIQVGLVPDQELFEGYVGLCIPNNIPLLDCNTISTASNILQQIGINIPDNIQKVIDTVAGSIQKATGCPWDCLKGVDCKSCLEIPNCAFCEGHDLFGGFSGGAIPLGSCLPTVGGQETCFNAPKKGDLFGFVNDDAPRQWITDMGQCPPGFGDCIINRAEEKFVFTCAQCHQLPGCGWCENGGPLPTFYEKLGHQGILSCAPDSVVQRYNCEVDHPLNPQRPGNETYWVAADQECPAAWHECFLSTSCSECKSRKGCGWCDKGFPPCQKATDRSAQLCKEQSGRDDAWNPDVCPGDLGRCVGASKNCGWCVHTDGCEFCALENNPLKKIVKGVCVHAETLGVLGAAGARIACSALKGKYYDREVVGECEYDPQVVESIIVAATATTVGASDPINAGLMGPGGVNPITDADGLPSWLWILLAVLGCLLLLVLPLVCLAVFLRSRRSHGRRRRSRAGSRTTSMRSHRHKSAAQSSRRHGRSEHTSRRSQAGGAGTAQSALFAAANTFDDFQEAGPAGGGDTMEFEFKKASLGSGQSTVDDVYAAIRPEEAVEPEYSAAPPVDVKLEEEQ